MIDSEKGIEIIKKSVQLRIYGIEVENSKQIVGKLGIPEGYKVYFSIPESSTIYDETKDSAYNEKLKTSAGLTQIGKEILMDIIMCSCSDEDVSIDEMTDFVKFYVKVRKGEMWTQEQSDEIRKKVDDELKTALEKMELLNDYEEV